jgi:hypothetical protein
MPETGCALRTEDGAEGGAGSVDVGEGEGLELWEAETRWKLFKAVVVETKRPQICRHRQISTRMATLEDNAQLERANRWRAKLRNLKLWSEDRLELRQQGCEYGRRILQAL